MKDYTTVVVMKKAVDADMTMDMTMMVVDVETMIVDADMIMVL
jgi:hypothetical protein